MVFAASSPGVNVSPIKPMTPGQVLLWIHSTHTREIRMNPQTTPRCLPNRCCVYIKIRVAFSWSNTVSPMIIQSSTVENHC